MNSMNDKEVAGYAEKLKSIRSDYQQIQKRVKELIRDVRGNHLPSRSDFIDRITIWRI